MDIKNKILLCMGLMFASDSMIVRGCYHSYNVTVKHYGDQDDLVLLSFLGGCTALAISAYLVLIRESNASVARKACAWYEQVRIDMQKSCNIWPVFAIMSDISIDDRENIFQLKQLLANRYGSWVKPWDWTVQMKKAYDRMTIVAALYGYLPLVQNQSFLTGQDVLYFARETFVGLTKYPCIMCLYNLEHDIVYLKNISETVNESILGVIKQVIPVLEKAKNLLRAEKELLDEMKIKHTHDLQKQQIGAILSRTRW